MSEGLQLYGSTENQLQTVNEAIYAILKGGQSYRIGTRQLQRADLAMLNKMKTQLEAELMNDTKSPLLGDTVVAVFDGR